MSETDLVTATRTLPLSKISRAAFAPYGTVLSGGLGDPSFSRPLLDNWRLPFKADAPPRLQVMRYYRQEIRFSKLERHLYVTETRIPIGHAQAVLVVAAENKTSSVPLPDPKSLTAFYLDGSCGVMFNAGVWHALDCFPVNSPYADFLFLSDASTEDEIESLGDAVTGSRTQVIDFYERQGLSFEVTDSFGLLAAHEHENLY